MCCVFCAESKQKDSSNKFWTNFLFTWRVCNFFQLDKNILSAAYSNFNNALLVSVNFRILIPKYSKEKIICVVHIFECFSYAFFIQ